MQEHKQELFDENPMMITEERHEVSQVIADAPRFQSLKFFGAVSVWDKDTTKQFAAVTVEVEPSVRLVVFRGTDETLIGWKEDFLMTYSPLVAAQTDAKEYLAKQASLWDGDLMISGHSKGGNLPFMLRPLKQKMCNCALSIFSALILLDCTVLYLKQKDIKI